MRRANIRVVVLPFLAATALSLLAGCRTRIHVERPPETKRQVVTDELHGIRIEDPYRWLEDQEAPETRAWIAAQTAHTHKVIQQVPGRPEVEAILTEAHRIAEWSPPLARQGRYFFTRKSPGAQLAVILMREGLHGADQTLVDPHGMSPHQTISVDIADVSDDGRLMLYSVRHGGEDEVALRFFDVGRRKDLEELPKARYGPKVWLANEQRLIYVRWNKEGPRVYSHKLGGPPGRDELLFGEGLGMDRIMLGMSASADERYLVYSLGHGHSTTEVILQDRRSTAPPVLLTPGAKAFFRAEFAGNRLVILTDWQAPMKRVMAADLARPGIEHWRELIPESEHPIEWFSAPSVAAGGKIVLHRLHRAVSRLEVYSPQGTLLKSLTWKQPRSIGEIRGKWDEPDLFFEAQSFTSPPQIHHLDLDELTEDVWQAPASHLLAGTALQTRQVSYRSKDGAEAPMFLVHREGIRLDGNNPTLLYGYGGFGVSVKPEFRELWAAFLKLGGVLAVANLRGGGELGEEWHRAGMREHKQNVFDDFLAAAEWLIARRYTNPKRLAILGGSNGGLLVGAAMTQRPELFQAVVCTYPLLDMLRYHKFLLGRLWVDEYGSADDPRQFEYLRAYSPYHNVKKGEDYPAVLFLTGDADTRVAPLHARKMAALMQWATASDRPVLLRYEAEFGHSRAMPVRKRIETDADVVQFLRWQLGMLE